MGLWFNLLALMFGVRTPFGYLLEGQGGGGTLV